MGTYSIKGALNGYISLSYCIYTNFLAYHGPGDMSFICTVTLTAELLDGGQQEGAQYAAHQC